jgi:hypothetical protein
VQVEIGTTHGPQSMRISFTDQRLTAHGGMVVWSQFLHQSAFRMQLARVLCECSLARTTDDSLHGSW